MGNDQSTNRRTCGGLFGGSDNDKKDAPIKQNGSGAQARREGQPAPISPANGNNATSVPASRRATVRTGTGGANLVDQIDQARNNAASAAAEKIVSEAKRRGIEAVIEVMRQSPLDVHIQYKSFQTLLALCCHEQTTTASHLSEIGAIELIIKSMNNFPQHQLIQQDGVGLLWSLSANVTDETRVREHGGVRSIVNAMSTFQSSAIMQHRGCGALFNLSNTMSSRSSVAQDGAIDAILACFRYHLQAAEVMQQACLSINPLADHDLNKVTIAEQGGIQLIIQAMRQHSQDEVVQRNGCGALHVLCALNSKNKVLVRESGGIPIVIACMHTHINSVKLLQRACGVLWNVTCLTTDQQVLTNQGWMGRSEVVRRVHKGDRELRAVCYDLSTKAFQLTHPLKEEHVVGQVLNASSMSGEEEEKVMKNIITFESEDASSVSLSVTDDHVMWSSLNNSADSKAVFNKFTADTLYQAVHSTNEVDPTSAAAAPPISIQFQTTAPNGFLPSSSDKSLSSSISTELGFSSPAELDMFLEFYGMWIIANGSVDESTKMIEIVCESRTNAQKLQRLVESISHQDIKFTRSHLNDEQTRFSVQHSVWYSIFSSAATPVEDDVIPPQQQQPQSLSSLASSLMDELLSDDDASFSHSSLTTTSSSSSSHHFLPWILRTPRLTRDQYRVIVRGLSSSSSSSSSDYETMEGTINDISSQAMCDEITQLVLYAGLSITSTSSSPSSSLPCTLSLSYSTTLHTPALTSSHITLRTPLHDEQTWCLNIEHPDHMIVTRRRILDTTDKTSTTSSSSATPSYSPPLLISNCNNDANKLVVVSLNGIDALISAMDTRPEHQGIQREACGALRNLSLLAANKPIIGKPHVIASVLNAMHHHLLDADIQEQACVLLYSISDTPEAILAICNNGGIEAVLAAIKTHMKKPSVLEEGFGLMYKLARTGLAQRIDIKKESFDLSNQATKLHPTHDGVKKYAIGMRNEWDAMTFASRYAHLRLDRELHEHSQSTSGNTSKSHSRSQSKRSTMNTSDSFLSAVSHNNTTGGSSSPPSQFSSLVQQQSHNNNNNNGHNDGGDDNGIPSVTEKSSNHNGGGSRSRRTTGH